MIKSAIKALGIIVIALAGFAILSLIAGSTMVGIEHVYMYFGASEKYAKLFSSVTLIFGLAWTMLTFALNEK